MWYYEGTEERVEAKLYEKHKKPYLPPQEQQRQLASFLLYTNLLPQRPSKGEEDKDTQREKVKDRRRRLERPGSF